MLGNSMAVKFTTSDIASSGFFSSRNSLDYNPLTLIRHHYILLLDLPAVSKNYVQQLISASPHLTRGLRSLQYLRYCSSL